MRLNWDFHLLKAGQTFVLSAEFWAIFLIFKSDFSVFLSLWLSESDISFSFDEYKNARLYKSMLDSYSNASIHIKSLYHRLLVRHFWLFFRLTTLVHLTSRLKIIYKKFTQQTRPDLFFSDRLVEKRQRPKNQDETGQDFFKTIHLEKPNWKSTG